MCVCVREREINTSINYTRYLLMLASLIATTVKISTLEMGELRLQRVAILQLLSSCYCWLGAWNRITFTLIIWQQCYVKGSYEVIKTREWVGFNACTFTHYLCDHTFCWTLQFDIATLYILYIVISYYIPFLTSRYALA